MQGGGLGLQVHQGPADAPQLGGQAHRLHPGQALASHHHAARIDRHGVLIADLAQLDLLVVAGLFAHWLGLAAEQGLVHHEVAAGQEHRVGRHPVPLGQQDQVAFHHLAAGNAHLVAVADNQGPGAGQLAQGGHGLLGLLLLVEGDAHDQQHEAQEHQGLAQVAQEQVDAAGPQEQQQHGLAHHPQGDGPNRAGLGRGQFVVAVRGETRRRLLGGETGPSVGVQIQ